MIQKFVYVTFQKEFIHCYPEAPEEVRYLRYPHRHMAHIKVEVEVFEDDREIEFIMLKHKLEREISLDKITSYSCEAVATNIFTFMQHEYSMSRDMRITVSEDGENGSVLVYKKREV